MNRIKNILLLFVVVAITLPAIAQKSDDTLPLDPAVRMGKLKNGLTYYIRHNAEPEKKVNFYIAQKVGSIQEDDNQRGLAHFLEHMCFNGTEHFPGKSLISYLESIGVKFGVNLNAYTSIEETVYNINDVPVEIPGAIDSCLWILHDWADGLTLDGEEIEKERGVIHEEWRQRRNANSRMLDQVLPIAYQGEKYAYRMPIGIMEVVDSFPHKALRDYYEKWYRPDLQGIIVVGDIDVDDIEKRIKTIFKRIKKAKNAAERVYYPVSDNEGLIFAQGTDKEQQNYAFQLFFKHDATPRELAGSKEVMYKTFVENTAISLLNQRYAEITIKNNPPFLGVSTSNGSFALSSTKDAFSLSMACKTEKINEALPYAFCELERARRFGFTESELNRQKAAVLASVEKRYAERGKITNVEYVEGFVRHFLENVPAISPELEYEISKEMLQRITLEEVNAVLPALYTKDNRVAISLAPENDSISYPGKEHIEMLLAAIEAAPLTPYVDTTNDAPLLEKLPEGGKVVATEEGVWGTTVWTLSNDIKVVVKPTDYKADEIIMSGISYGGTSRYPDSDRVNLAMFGTVVALGGAGSFDIMQLSKKLAGSTAGANIGASTYLDGISGSCSPKDLEDMLQLMYLKYTSPRMDTAALNSFKTRQKGAFRDRDKNPNTALSDSINKALYCGHPRMKPLVADDIDSINYDRIMEMYKDRTADAGDFTFVFVGNINVDTLKPLVERYIGGLPSNGRKEELYDHKLTTRRGIYRNNFTRKMETPTGTEVIFYSGDIEANLRNSILMSYVEQIMDLVYTAEVREKEGGTYGVAIQGDIEQLPKGEFTLTIQFNMSPERREELTKIVINELEKVAKEGPVEEHLEKVRSYMLKGLDEQAKQNGSWNNWLMQYYFYDTDYYSNRKEIVESITKDDVRLFLSSLLEQGNFIEVSMVPEK